MATLSNRKEFNDQSGFADKENRDGFRIMCRDFPGEVECQVPNRTCET